MELLQVGTSALRPAHTGARPSRPAVQELPPHHQDSESSNEIKVDECKETGKDVKGIYKCITKTPKIFETSPTGKKHKLRLSAEVILTGHLSALIPSHTPRESTSTGGRVREAADPLAHSRPFVTLLSRNYFSHHEGNLG